MEVFQQIVFYKHCGNLLSAKHQIKSNEKQQISITLSLEVLPPNEIKLSHD